MTSPTAAGLNCMHNGALANVSELLAMTDCNLSTSPLTDCSVSLCRRCKN